MLNDESAISFRKFDTTYRTLQPRKAKGKKDRAESSSTEEKKKEKESEEQNHRHKGPLLAKDRLLLLKERGLKSKTKTRVHK